MFSLFKTTVIGGTLLQGAVDNHSHILWGLDDGVKTKEDSYTILSYLEENGLRELWFTPHIMEDLPNTTEGILSRFEELKAGYKGSLELHCAAEYMMDNNYAKRLRSRDLLLHGGNLVLVETSTMAPPLDFWELLQETMSGGYRPLLAHPERYGYMSGKDYERLQDMGVFFQLNLPSITGFYGKQVKARAEYLLRKGWYCMSGSDCHRFGTLTNQYSKLKFEKKYLEALSALKNPQL